MSSRTPQWQHSEYLILIQNLMVIALGIFEIKAIVDQVLVRELGFSLSILLLLFAVISIIKTLSTKGDHREYFDYQPRA